MEYNLINPINDNYTALEQVLTNRGIKYQDIPHYLRLTAQDDLSPSLLMNIDKGVALLQKHLAMDEGKIFVQVDADYDGYSAAATLLNYIYSICPSALYKFSYRLHLSKIHGILPDTIPEGTTLVIAPDSSSNEEDIHRQLVEKGIDVLVLDHHQADKVSDYACVINNQLCDYPNKTLSGVGIVYKFCQRIDELLGLRAAEDLLDMVATGLN